MISAEKIRELAVSPKLYVIRHIESDYEYSVSARQKGKFNGIWYDGILYYSRQDGKNYWRPETDFEGFEIVN